MSDEKQKKFRKAYLAFRKEIKNPDRNAKNGHFKDHEYTSLDSLIECVTPELSKNDLFLVENFIQENGSDYLEIRIEHLDGGSTSSKLPISPDRDNLQGLGSAVTYLRRYIIESICGVSGSKDDDGNAAVSTGYTTNLRRSGGPARNSQPSDAQKKYYNTLFKQVNGRDMNEDDKKEASAMSGAAISKAINEMKQQMDS